ncbi:MAG: EAL domain-containing protein [Pseudomonadales bacterium]|nr:EAL domain-containing protein [Pseudomonadales bacterium]
MPEKNYTDVIHANNNHLQTILDTVGTAILSFDSSGNLVLKNAQADTLFKDIKEVENISSAVMRSKYNFYDKNNEFIAFNHSPVYKAIHGQKTMNTRIRIENQNSMESHWFLLNASPLFDNKDEADGCVICLNEITELVESNQRIKKYALYDPLTNLPNRRLLMDELRKSISYTRRYNRFAAVLFIDLDNFKNVNDLWGHELGDHLLQAVAKRLKDITRDTDILSRLGGDEFVCILNDLSADLADAMHQAKLFSERIITMLEKEFTLGEVTVNAPCSIGIIIYPDVDSTPERLLQYADTALYQAKDKGKKISVMFNPEMTEDIAHKVQLQNLFHHAAQRDIFHIVMQPQYRADNGELSGAEVLLRCQLNSGKFISPDDFIPILEQSADIVEVGYWIVRQTCLQFSQWLTPWIWQEGAHISINVSPRQLQDINFCPRFMAIIEEYEIPAKMLVIEITESLFAAENDVMVDNLMRIHEHGIKLSMDDFGTGYSSLSYLKRFPLDYLKIDRCFVNELETNNEDRAVVQAIMAVCQEFGIEVVAEGVETLEQAKILQNIGCHYFQGYYFARPMKLDDFSALLSDFKAQAI